MEELFKEALVLVGGGLFTLSAYIFKGVISQLRDLKVTQQGLVRQGIVIESDIMNVKEKVNKNIENILIHERRLDGNDLKLAEIKTVHNASECNAIKLS